MKADELSGRRVLNSAIKLCDQLERMAGECETEKQRAQFLAVARELRPSLQLLGSVNGEIVSASVQGFMAALGVQSESEIRSALQLTRQDVTLDDLFAEALEALRFVLRERPALRGEALRLLAGEVAGGEVEGKQLSPRNGNGNGNGGVPHP